MLRQLGSICAALVVAGAVSSAPAQARSGGHYGGGHYSGAHFSGAHYSAGVRYSGVRAIGVAGRYAGYRSHYYGGRYSHYYGHWHHRYGRYWGPYYGGYYGDYWGYYAAAEPYYDYTDAVSYCIQRFRTYDPSSGTYVGYDGYRHPCP